MKLLSLNELDPLCSLGAKVERAPDPTAADKRKAAFEDFETVVGPRDPRETGAMLATPGDVWVFTASGALVRLEEYDPAEWPPCGRGESWSVVSSPEYKAEQAARNRAASQALDGIKIASDGAVTKTRPEDALADHLRWSGYWAKFDENSYFRKLGLGE